MAILDDQEVAAGLEVTGATLVTLLLWLVPTASIPNVRDTPLCDASDAIVFDLVARLAACLVSHDSSILLVAPSSSWPAHLVQLSF